MCALVSSPGKQEVSGTRDKGFNIRVGHERDQRRYCNELLRARAMYRLFRFRGNRFVFVYALSRSEVVLSSTTQWPPRVLPKHTRNRCCLDHPRHRTQNTRAQKPHVQLGIYFVLLVSNPWRTAESKGRATQLTMETEIPHYDTAFLCVGIRTYWLRRLFVSTRMWPHKCSSPSSLTAHRFECARAMVYFARDASCEKSCRGCQRGGLIVLKIKCRGEGGGGKHNTYWP